MDAGKHGEKKWCNEKIALPLNITIIHQQEERLQAETLNKMYLLFLKDFKIIAFQQWQMSIGGYRYSNDQGDEGGSLLMWSPDYTVGRLSDRHLQFESTSEESSWFFEARHSWYNRALWVTSRTTCSKASQVVFHVLCVATQWKPMTAILIKTENPSTWFYWAYMCKNRSTMSGRVFIIPELTPII